MVSTESSSALLSPPTEPSLSVLAIEEPAHKARLATLAGDCPYLLKRMARQRTLHDYSCSYLWVEALPGIEWAQSVAEILEYTASRLRPGANHAALRRNYAGTIYSADRGSWARLSQGRRILRWIASRQARPATMHSVHAALSQVK